MFTKKKYITWFIGIIVFIVMPIASAQNAFTLEECVQLALDNNKQIKAADRGAQVAKWNLEKAKGAENVTVDLSHTTQKIGGEFWKVYYIENDPSNYFINTLSASVPIYTGGRIENTIKQAKLGSEVSDLQLLNVKQEVKYRTTQAYFAILACQNMQQVKMDAVAQLTEHLHNVQAQFNVGTVTKADVLRSEVALANAKQSLVTAENDTKLAISTLNKIMGNPIQQEVKIADILSYEPMDYQLDDCIFYAMQHRPDLLATQKVVEQSEAGIKIAAAAKKPDITMSASYGTYDTKFDEFDTKQWLVGVTAHMNIFDGNVTKAGVNAAKEMMEQAKQQEDDAVANVEFDVQQAYLNMTKSARNIETNKIAVDKATEDFMLAGMRYSVNLGTNLDVVDAQVALTAAKTAYIESLYDYNISKAALDKAIGKTINIK